MPAPKLKPGAKSEQDQRAGDLADELARLAVQDGQPAVWQDGKGNQVAYVPPPRVALLNVAITALRAACVSGDGPAHVDVTAADGTRVSLSITPPDVPPATEEPRTAVAEDGRECAVDVIRVLRDDPEGRADLPEQQIVTALRAKGKTWPVELVRAKLVQLYAAGMVGRDGKVWFAE